MHVNVLTCEKSQRALLRRADVSVHACRGMILSVRYTPVVGFVRRESVLHVLNIVVIRLHGKVAPLGGKVLIVTTPDTFDAVNPGGSQRRSPRVVTVEDIGV